MTTTPPGEGERRAQRGYVRQYQAAAAIIWDALDRDELVWVGLADRRAGIADDVVLGFRGRVVGHQFKTSKYAGTFTLRTLFLGAGGLFEALIQSWRQLTEDFPEETVEVRLVTSDYPSKNDALVGGKEGHTAAFLRDLEQQQEGDLAGLRSSKWKPWFDELEAKSGLTTEAFDAFLTGLRLFWGPRADFLHAYRLTPAAAAEARKIADLLPRLIADGRDCDRWSRQSLLDELGWRDTFAIRRPHQFPIGLHVQRNVSTEQDLAKALRSASTGYIALIGPPGSGKSTTLQSAIASCPNTAVVRYLAFMPGEGQGVGRAEAEDFLDDVNGQLKQSGLSGLRFQAATAPQRREEFETLLKAAGHRFQVERLRTLIVVDGLDHIPREETPQRSLLAELPLPAAVPEGVTFVLGTQRLDLAGLKPAVRSQAGKPDRRVDISPLSRDAIDRMAEALGLDRRIDRGRVAEIGGGHPLATRYLIGALRSAPEARQAALLDGEFSFGGDIETVYEGAWRDVGEEVKLVVEFLARADGQIPPELLAKVTSEEAVERALARVGHLLEITPKGWAIFHNSFRLFILAKPKLKFGKVDPDYDRHLYDRLADLSLEAKPPSPQRWLELRYRSRAGQHDKVLRLATADRFRQQLADGRSDAEILIDLRLAFKAVAIAKSAPELFRLLLARDEIERRSQALGYATTLVTAFLAVGDFDRAMAYAINHEKGGFEVVDALLAAGDIDGARSLFDRIEPQATPTGIYAHDPSGHQNQIQEWTSRVFHFRDTDQILEAVDRFTGTFKVQNWRDEKPSDYTDSLRFSVARAAIAGASNEADSGAIAASLQVDEGYLPYLLLEAAERAMGCGDPLRAHALYNELVLHPAFLGITNRRRRDVALAFAALEDKEAARSIFASLSVPGVANMKETTGDEASIQISDAIADHAELAAFLGEEPGFPKAEGAVLTPLQNHLAVAGSLLGRARTGEGITAGEVVRATKSALSYLSHAKAPGISEFYSVYQLAAAAPSLAKRLILASWRVGESEFKAVLGEFDNVFAQQGELATRLNIRKEVALGAFLCDGDQPAAVARLEPMVGPLQEQTPEQQVELLATLAIAFARVGASDRARQLVAQVHDNTFGYAIAAKKDPQYALWRDLMVEANAMDPDRRRSRVVFLLRVVIGMMSTEGRDSGYRIAAELLIEASTCDAGLGLAIGKALAEAGALSWSALVNALLLGTVRRKPSLAACCAIVWSRLALPFYAEPHYRPEALGDFITEAIAAVATADLPIVLSVLQTRIETDSRPHVRADLIGRLKAAAELREVSTPSLIDADARWRKEAPPDRDRFTPQTYDAIASLAELQIAFEKTAATAEDGKPSYDGTSAFRRLLKNEVDLELAKAMFAQWPLLQEDSHARFALVHAAIAGGDDDYARRLTVGYLDRRDDLWGNWSRWYGGGRLRYFKARVALDGAPARSEAFADLCDALGAGKESSANLLVDFDDIFPLIVDCPDWAGMWDALAAQLAMTREYQLGVTPADPDPLDDTRFITDILRWALELSQVELARGVRMAVRALPAIDEGEEIFSDICAALLRGGVDEPLLATQILAAGNYKFCQAELASAVRAVAECTDLAAAEFARRVLDGWGEPTDFPVKPLPAFYSLALDIDDEEAELRVSALQRAGGLDLEDPLGWTRPFAGIIKHLARGHVTAAHIRRRCTQFIDSWGGAVAVRTREADLRNSLARLDMRLTFTRPSGIAAMRAIRNVIGEMRLAGVIEEPDLQFLIGTLTQPTLGEPDLAPQPRPTELHRPSLGSIDYRTGEADWLDAARDDLAPFEVQGLLVLAEIYRFSRIDSRRSLNVERVRAPFYLEGDDAKDGLDGMPDALWLDGVRIGGKRPSPTIVRVLKYSDLAGAPERHLVLCPLWLRQLSWRRHPQDPLAYLDATGRRVAQMIWWRDGLAQDVIDQCFSSSGVLLTLTDDGWHQIEAVAGPLKIVARATRSFRDDDGQPYSHRTEEIAFT